MESSGGGSGGAGGGGGWHPIDQLILQIALEKRDPVVEELPEILAYIAHLGFRPTSAAQHYQKHVVEQREWPENTGLDAYISSIAELVLDPESGVLLSNWQNREWHVSILRKSRELQGPGGFEWAVVEYRVGSGSWTTAFQPISGLEGVVRDRRRVVIRWLRRPK